MSTMEEVYRLKEQGLTHKQIGTRLGFSERTSSRKYKSFIDSSNDNGTIRLINEKPFTSIERFKPLVRTGDVLISCDWHIPLHSPKLVNDLLRTADKYKIENLIIGGDFWNFDTFSHYLPHQPEADFDIERKTGTDILDCLLDYFKEVDFISGNHDFRLVRKLDYALSFEYTMQWALMGLAKEKLARIRISDLDYMYYKNDLRNLRICHPKNFSKIPLTVARQLALKYNCDVMTAHSHHLAMGFSQDGTHMIFDGGGLYDKTRTEYIQKTTLHHEWVQGFTVFKDNIPTQFSPIIGNI